MEGNIPKNTFEEPIFLILWTGRGMWLQKSNTIIIRVQITMDYLALN